MIHEPITIIEIYMFIIGGYLAIGFLLFIASLKQLEWQYRNILIIPFWLLLFVIGILKEGITNRINKGELE